MTATWPPARIELAAALIQAAKEEGREQEEAAAIELVRHAIDLVQHLDPAGVGARDLRECLLIQIAAHQHEFALVYAAGGRCGR